MIEVSLGKVCRQPLIEVSGGKVRRHLLGEVSLGKVGVVVSAQSMQLCFISLSVFRIHIS